MSRTLKEAFYFFRHNLFKLLSYTLSIGLLVVFLPQLLNTLFFSDVVVPVDGAQEAIQPFTHAVNLLIQPIYSGGMIILIFSLAQGRAKTIVECLLAGLIRWPFMFLGNVITTLMILGGLMLFVIPGIWLFTRLFLVPFLIMLNNQSPFEAIANSFQYTKGYSFTLLNDIIILIVIFILGVLIFNFMQILHPVILLLFLLLIQSMANVVYYRHYEILLKKNKIDMDDANKPETEG